MEYLEKETGVFDPADVTFLRSAQVGDAKFWIWEFYDCSGVHYYATVMQRPNRGPCFGCEFVDGLTPDQAMLADYHGCY